MCPHKVDTEVKYDASANRYMARHRRMVIEHKIEECIESLSHSCLCHDAFCRRNSCMKMKRVVIHTKICKRKIKGNCPICKQLIVLCCYHAKKCKEEPCWVPFCNTVKTKMRRQNVLFDRLDAARDLLRSSRPDPDEAGDSYENIYEAHPFGDDCPSLSGWNYGEARPGEAGPSRARNSADGDTSDDNPGGDQDQMQSDDEQDLDTD